MTGLGCLLWHEFFPPAVPWVQRGAWHLHVLWCKHKGGQLPEVQSYGGGAEIVSFSLCSTTFYCDCWCLGHGHGIETGATGRKKEQQGRKSCFPTFFALAWCPVSSTASLGTRIISRPFLLPLLLPSDPGEIQMSKQVLLVLCFLKNRVLSEEREESVGYEYPFSNYESLNQLICSMQLLL